MSTHKKNVVVKISDRDKVLKRPNRFIGAVKADNLDGWYYINDKFEKRSIYASRGLQKLVAEIYSNSIDEAIRTNFQYANKIDISVTNGYITVSDNGRGIPIVPMEGINDAGIMMPEGAWCVLSAGSNFEDEDDNVSQGMNGEGAALVNIFSKEFYGETISEGKIFKLKCTNNMETTETEVRKSTKACGTTVKFLPDYERFELTGFSQDAEYLLITDLINMSLVYPDIKFTYNGKAIKARNFKEYVKLFGIDTCEIVEERNISIAIMPNELDTFEFVHYINGLNVFQGGKPLEWVMKNVTQGILDKVVKKYPNIKAGDIRNKLFAVAVFSNMINPRFEDQIKSICSNTYTDFASQIDVPDWDKFASKILKNSAIIDPITEVYKIKEELKKRQELKGLEKGKKKIKSEKYLPSIQNKKYLIVCEGASASGGLIPVLGRKECGFYELKGKPLNAITASHDKFKANKELTELYQIVKNEGYEYIIIASDADLDGIHIRGLMMGFVSKMLPERMKGFGILNTPVIIVKKAGKIVRWHYDLDEDIKVGSGETSKYLKGLGSHNEADLKYIIAQEGLEKMIDMIDFSTESNILMEWLSDDTSDKRKEYILENDFSIAQL